MHSFKSWTCGEVAQVMKFNRRRVAMLCAMHIRMPPPFTPLPDEQTLYIISYCDRRDGGKIVLISGEQRAIEAYLELYAREHTLVAQLLKQERGGVIGVKIPGCDHKGNAQSLLANIWRRKSRRAIIKNASSDFVLMPKKLSDVPRKPKLSGNFEVILK